MRLRTTCSEIYKYQQEAEEKMEWLRETYLAIGDNKWKSFSLWKRFKVNFKYPLSLRLFHYSEFLVGREILNTMVKYRKLYHNYWSVVNLFEKVPDTEDEIKLDSFETGVILNLRQYR